MKLLPALAVLLIGGGALAHDALAQVSAEAKHMQDQAAAVVANAGRCPQNIPKGEVDRFAARATALILRADRQPVARGPSGDYEVISASLLMEAKCMAVQCPGKPNPLLPPNCLDYTKAFRSLKINQAGWTLNDGLR